MTPDGIMQTMLFAESSRPIAEKAFALIQAGRSVKLTSHAGYSVFQPLADGETGREIPRSAGEVYNSDGLLIERRVS